MQVVLDGESASHQQMYRKSTVTVTQSNVTHFNSAHTAVDVRMAPTVDVVI